jgi:aminoglycoside phosphotransferase (APT) family kinase protein
MNAPLILRDKDSILRQYVEESVANRLGLSSEIAEIQRTRTRYIGSYDCDSVTVRLVSGEEFKFFLKDYGSSLKSKDEPVQRRERELTIYRDLLSKTDLGTAGYYGSVWDESGGRYWLLLELVEGVLIKDHNVEQGEFAAGWLGRAQGFFTQHPELLSGHDHLTRHDANFYRSKANHALRDVCHIDPESVPKLTKIVGGYQQAIDVMTAQPPTLVHGGFIPWHILLNYDSEPVRVCPIDWELAAIGSAFHDLAYFTDDADPETRDRVLGAYWRAAGQFNAPVPDRAQLGYIVDCFRLHRIFDWLSRAVEKQFSSKKVSLLVDQAEQQNESLLAG